ncbi:MAG: hypothetical protein L0241_31965 [Planctomycetia bacterium]|nr:hypothetical protein [Planctomycetia bacterium]
MGGLRSPVRDPFTQITLRPGEYSSLDFSFKQFGYFLTLGAPGRYRLEATLKIDGKTITSPPVELDVVAVPEDAVLVNQLIPLEGAESLKPPDEQEWPVIQQVKVGDRTLLIYRRYNPTMNGGKAGMLWRLAELPGKVEMKVEGAFGAGKPLTITYQEAKPPTGTTKLVINSIGGTPWTAEEEQLLREQREREQEASIAPPPRPGKP